MPWSKYRYPTCDMSDTFPISCLTPALDKLSAPVHLYLDKHGFVFGMSLNSCTLMHLIPETHLVQIRMLYVSCSRILFKEVPS